MVFIGLCCFVAYESKAMTLQKKHKVDIFHPSIRPIRVMNNKVGENGSVIPTGTLDRYYANYPFLKGIVSESEFGDVIEGANKLNDNAPGLLGVVTGALCLMCTLGVSMCVCMSRPKYLFHKHAIDYWEGVKKKYNTSERAVNWDYGFNENTWVGFFRASSNLPEEGKAPLVPAMGVMGAPASSPAGAYYNAGFAPQVAPAPQYMPYNQQLPMPMQPQAVPMAYPQAQAQGYMQPMAYPHQHQHPQQQQQQPVPYQQQQPGPYQQQQPPEYQQVAYHPSQYNQPMYSPQQQPQPHQQQHQPMAYSPQQQQQQQQQPQQAPIHMPVKSAAPLPDAANDAPPPYGLSPSAPSEL